MKRNERERMRERRTVWNKSTLDASSSRSVRPRFVSAHPHLAIIIILFRGEKSVTHGSMVTFPSSARFSHSVLDYLGLSFSARSGSQSSNVRSLFENSGRPTPLPLSLPLFLGFSRNERDLSSVWLFSRNRHFNRTPHSTLMTKQGIIFSYGLSNKMLVTRQTDVQWK